ncbi:hypothetical protein PPYR_12945 [Photinus pyralis]|uniref:tRNA-splicing endonuclease subunit Sen2 n=1 Tax=Photinus pyralis TaxID=7054 RepID=A0A1Y1LKY6_PHOPY|nr:tRNA-splicing endonuclease subunit Sen2 [Photinus pyralis]KAB0793325.1 hypothetical protein PPYR_12945 [Photinus pyralis]
MELKRPRSKKSYHQSSSFKGLLNGQRYSGHYDNFSVIVTEGIQELHTKGCFGKGNFSRGYPSFGTADRPQIIRKRVFEQRNQVKSTRTRKVIVTPDSDNESEYFTNLQPQYFIDSSALTETLHLTLEEAYFLSHSLNCLDVYHNRKLLEPQELWSLFVENDKYFVQNYAVYLHFRSKNWVVKSGIKFGGDYLLYKEGPAFYHASYLVIIDVLDANSRERKLESCRRSMDIVTLSGLNRLCETVGKELLICQVLWPSDMKEVYHSDLQKLQISEVLMRRWVPSENRDLLEY